MVTKLLERAIAEASKLTSAEQDEIAALILGELEADVQWDEVLQSSSGQLHKLAEEALTEHREGKTKRLDPDQL